MGPVELVALFFLNNTKRTLYGFLGSAGLATTS